MDGTDGLKRRVREAYDAVTAPEEAKAAVLAAYDNMARSNEGAADASDRPALALDEPRPPVSKRKPAFILRPAWFAAAACLVLALVGFGGYRLYFDETAYVSIEINPAIELGVNRFDIVVAQRALNDDGAQVLDGLNLAGKSVDEALSALAQDEVLLSYATEDAFVDVNVACDVANQASSLVSDGDEFVSALPCEGECSHVSNAERDEALEAGMGVGRYQAAQKLMELDPSLTLEDCLQMTMRELRDKLAALGYSESSNEGVGTYGGHQGEGHGSRSGKNADSDGSVSTVTSGRGSGQGSGQGASRGNGAASSVSG